MKTTKRVLAAVLTLIIAVSICACSDSGNDVGEVDPSGTAVKTEVNMLGFICLDNYEVDNCLAMHSFLQTAENLGVNAKLYRCSEVQSIEELAQTAISDGCDGVMISTNDAAADILAINVLCEAGVSVVTFLDDVDISEIDAASVKIDDDAVSAVPEFLSADLSDKYVTQGSIAIYGQNAGSVAESITIDGPHSIVGITANSADTDTAVSELKSRLTAGGIVGIVALTPQDAQIAVKAAKGIKVKTTATTSPDAAQNEEINLIVVGIGLDDTAAKLFEDGLYGLGVRPMYEAATQAVLTLYDVASGESYQKNTVTGTHIANANTIEKYISLRRSSLMWFGLVTPTLAPTPTPINTPAATITPTP